MSAGDAQDYLDDQGVSLIKGLKTGSFLYTTGQIKNMIDLGRPFYLIEKSRWGACHAVVLRGYDEDFMIDPYFLLNDPDTLTGTNTMYWYDTDSPNFNYEENVYEYIESDDTSSIGYYYLG